MDTSNSLVQSRQERKIPESSTLLAGLQKNETATREVCWEKPWKIRERKQVKTHGEKFHGYMEKGSKTCEVQVSEVCRFEDNKPDK